MLLPIAAFALASIPISIAYAKRREAMRGARPSTWQPPAPAPAPSPVYEPAPAPSPVYEPAPAPSPVYEPAPVYDYGPEPGPVLVDEVDEYDPGPPPAWPQPAPAQADVWEPDGYGVDVTIDPDPPPPQPAPAPLPTPAPEPAPPPPSGPVAAAHELREYAIEVLEGGQGHLLGVRGAPSPVVRDLQARMGGIDADGFYGPQTRGRIYDLTGVHAPVRR